MYMARNGDKIMNAMSAAMAPKLKDPANQKHLQDTCARMKRILKLWVEIMRTMKSTEYQTDEDCLGFKRNTTALKKEINSLVTNPPVPGCGLKHSKQLRSHLLFDGEIHDPCHLEDLGRR